MRLTNAIREKIVAQIMSDTPATDYASQMQDRADEITEQLLPVEMRKFWRDAKTRGFFNTGPTYINYCPVSGLEGETNAYKSDEKLINLSELRSKQSDNRRFLPKKIEDTLRSYTTAKQLKEHAPEFAKYLPSESAVDKRTPAVIDNLVSELIQIGWPDKKK